MGSLETDDGKVHYYTSLRDSADTFYQYMGRDARDMILDIAEMKEETAYLLRDVIKAIDESADENVRLSNLAEELEQLLEEYFDE